jgi:nicotinamidase-related amidase
MIQLSFPIQNSVKIYIFFSRCKSSLQHAKTYQSNSPRSYKMGDHNHDDHSSIFATIGPESKAWHFNARGNERVFDLTRDDLDFDPDSNREAMKPHLKVKVSTGAYINTSIPRSALVIIDMQNYFLSSALGRSRGSGHVACDNLIQYAIPAARKAGMQVIWLNWGLTDEDLKTMPPAVTRCFGFFGYAGVGGKARIVLDRHGNARKSRVYAGLGSPMGSVSISESEGGPREVDAGNVLMRDTWNADLYPSLTPLYHEGLHLTTSPKDVWIHKNRMSGLWGTGTPLQNLLQDKGITTLYFAGVNTDQCVGGTLTDAFSNGYDCVLLRDGCGTTSPDCAQQAWEFNCENTFGFVVKCQDLYDAVDASRR